MAAAEFSQAAEELAAALVAAINDPADAIRLLLPLTEWMPPLLPGRGPLADRARDVQDALAANLRSTACAALAQATIAYEPVSYQDAQSVRHLVCDALDAEATRSADAARDATYQALRELRTAVALDLAARGAHLAYLVEIETRVSMPSLAMAWTLYQDTTREPQLVASAAPRHPLFLPMTFPALAS
jgi:prophage DNA circulation protein